MKMARGATSVVTSGHCNSFTIEVEGIAAGEAGKIRAFAKLILLQTAQKSWATPAGAFRSGEDGAAEEPFADTVKMVEEAGHDLTLPG